MDADLLAALPVPIALALEAGDPISIGGIFAGSVKSLRQGETPESGPGAIRRWLDLYDRAAWLIGEPDKSDPRPQHTASQAIDSLFRYEHQMTPLARRQAREALWQRDRPDEPLPTTALHLPDEPFPTDCHCLLCRSEWEQCRCRTCRLARLLNRPSSS